MNKLLLYFSVCLISLFALSSCFEKEEEEPIACDIITIYSEYNAFSIRLAEIQADTTVTCEDQKSFGQEVYDFYTSNKDCLFEAIDTYTPSTAEAALLKTQIETSYEELDKALKLECP